MKRERTWGVPGWMGNRPMTAEQQAWKLTQLLIAIAQNKARSTETARLTERLEKDRMMRTRNKGFERDRRKPIIPPLKQCKPGG